MMIFCLGDFPLFKILEMSIIKLLAVKSNQINVGSADWLRL